MNTSSVKWLSCQPRFPCKRQLRIDIRSQEFYCKLLPPFRLQSPYLYERENIHVSENNYEYKIIMLLNWSIIKWYIASQWMLVQLCFLSLSPLLCIFVSKYLYVILWLWETGERKWGKRSNECRKNNYRK